MTDEIKRLGEQILGHKPDSQEWQIALRAYELGARPQEREFLQEGDYYWLVHDNGRYSRSAWVDNSIHRGRLCQGNVFPLPEAALCEARRREVKARIAAINAEESNGQSTHTYWRLVRDRSSCNWDARRSWDSQVAYELRLNSKRAANRVLAEIPAEDLDLLTMAPEFVPPKLEE